MWTDDPELSDKYPLFRELIDGSFIDGVTYPFEMNPPFEDIVCDPIFDTA